MPDKQRKIIDKWKELLEETNNGISITNQTSTQSGTNSNIFASIAFPLVKRVMATTLGSDPELLKKAEKRVIAENREKQIDSILEDKDFEPTKLEDTEEYKEYQKGIVSVKPMSAPSGTLFYLDYVYKPIKIKKKNKHHHRKVKNKK